MKFNCNKKQLLEAIGQSGLAVSTKTTLPVLSHLLIKAGKDGIEIVGNNLRTQIKTGFSATVDSEGAACLPFKLLQSFVGTLGDDIQFDLTEKRMLISSGRAVSKMAFIQADEFAGELTCKNQPFFEVESKFLVKAMMKVRPAIEDKDSTRMALQAMLFSFDEKGLMMLGTNGKRVAISRLDIKLLKEKKAQFSMPIEIVDQLIGLGRDSTAILHFSMDEQVIVIESDDWTLAGKKMEQQFPEVLKYLPSEKGKTVTVQREDLLHLARQCRMFVNPNLNPAMKLTFGNKVLQAVVTTGEHPFENEIPFIGKADLQIAVPPDNVADAINVMDSDKVTMVLRDDRTPLELSEEGFVCYVMPMLNV